MGTILIVDDRFSAREVLRGLLAGQGYHLAFATNGLEGLEKAAKLTPDLILLDIMMPGMNGFEVCKQLRINPLLAEVPIIMLTALDDRESRLQAISAGADDFISKPFDYIELEARVRTITKLNRYRRLHKERQKFHWVVRESEDGYLLVDDNDKILYANPQACLYLSLPVKQNQQLTASFLEITAQQYHYEPETAWVSWPEESTVMPRYLVRAESATDNAFWLQVKIFKLPDTQNKEWMVQLRDVTTQMTLQHNMWQFEEIISHKLRTPLQIMLMGLELLKEEGIKNSWSSSASDLFEMVFENTQRLQSDVENTLQYLQLRSLIQSGTGLNLSELESLVTQISHDLALKKVTVSDQTSAKSASLLLSKQAVELILREILGNSKKFHPEQAPTVQIKLTSPDNNKQVSIQISDNGISLSPQQLARIWTPYYQVDKYVTGEVTGMGLGLSKVALLVWQVGGKCRIYNQSEGLGIIVELILPLKHPSRLTNHQSRHPIPIRKKGSKQP